MCLVPGLGGAFNNSLPSHGVKVKCTIFSGSSSTPNPPDVPPEWMKITQWMSYRYDKLECPRVDSPRPLGISIHIRPKTTWPHEYDTIHYYVSEENLPWRHTEATFQLFDLVVDAFLIAVILHIILWPWSWYLTNCMLTITCLYQGIWVSLCEQTDTHKV